MDTYDSVVPGGGMKILVTGATGFVGGHLVPALLGRGHSVRALVRDRGRYQSPDAGPGELTVVEGDLLEPGGLSDAFADVDTAYYLVHSMLAGEDFEERDRRAAGNFATAASAAGVERVVYLGGLGVEGDTLSRHLRSRREVETVLAEGSYALTTLRAAIIVGDGSASFSMIRQLADRLPVMVAPKWVTNECQPIFVGDVIAYLVGVLDAPKTAGDTFEIGGPEVLTYGQLLRVTARVSRGRAPLIISVPVLTPRLSSYWVGLMTDVDWRVARPLIDGLKNPVIVQDDSIREHVPVDLTSFETAVERALSGDAGERRSGNQS